ncbi:MAG: alpha/beta hydrolase-fold protein [Bacteroidota bacterium]
MKTFIGIGILALMLGCTAKNGQETDLYTTLMALSDLPSDEERSNRVNAIWDSLKTEGQIPFRQDSTVLFLYRGEAESVHWNGDFNSWSGADQVKNKGMRIEGTDVWVLKTTFPSDARLDYKITVNEEEWILDPSNPLQQWSGFGPNSELRMPDWQPEVLKEPIPDAPKGTLTEYQVIESASMGYAIQYQVYTPAGYGSSDTHAVLYIADGQEYGDPKLGNVPIMLDNLIYLNRIEQVIAVFVSPLNPDDETQNRRADEFRTNPDYLQFYVDELIPHIDSNFNTKPEAEHRGILGTSFGGLNATYFAFTRPDVFGKAAIQAPAYWYNEDIFEMVEDSPAEQPVLFMSVGTQFDGMENTRRMKAIFDRKAYSLTYMEVNEGHSWGAWSAQADDLLIALFGIN